MVMNEEDFLAIDNAALEHFVKKKISQRCPRCGNEMECIEYGNSYVVRCKTDGCISDSFRGI